ncbi:MucB/RseB C-terminal domain-containing protein [Glaciecola sp. 1036]|uniref:MucB/RseB C-terminal domain-containing protein n=1 Tax=Alteromonadaceae TaxID=72275 RepID=UPI003D05EF55
MSLLKNILNKRTILSAFIIFTSCVCSAFQATEPTNEPSDVQPEVSDTRNFTSADDWLKYMSLSIDDASFEAFFVVNTDKKETQPYLWRKGKTQDGIPIEQLSLLNGPGSEQFAYQGKVSIIEPGYPAYSIAGDYVRSPIPDALMRSSELLEKGYDSIIMARNRIAGRMAQQVRVVSKDKTRFGYHLWIDETTGMLLKLNTYNLEGQLIEQIQMTQIKFGDEVDQVFANFNPDYLPEVRTVYANQEIPFSWDVSYMPVGMEVVKRSQHRIQGTGQLTEYIMLSDGLIDVSIYLIKANLAFDEKQSWHSGLNAVVTKSDGQYQVTVLGRLPSQTAYKIANSIILVDQK